jgi:hypothetical protein
MMTPAVEPKARADNSEDGAGDGLAAAGRVRQGAVHREAGR